MQRPYGIIAFLLLLCVSLYNAQNPTTPVLPDWNGDPNLCTVSPSPTPSPTPGPPLPKFTKQAEFTMERVEIKHLLNTSLPSESTLYQYIYDYDANALILIKNKNGFTDAEYFYYNSLKKSTYYQGQYCTVTDIPRNNDMDGASAIQLPNGDWHIRPMNEFLLFSSDDSSRRVVPTYMGQDVVRGIPVDKWQSCYINKTDYRTVRRIWFFARSGVQMPTGTVGDIGVPVQALISASYSLPNGTQLIEFDEVFNIISFRPGIIESSSFLAPPKGVFCSSGPGQDLISLKDIGVSWPNRFSVRVDASSSRSSMWQRFHLRYDQGREGESRRIRYDFLPPGAEDFQTVIHDYADNLTYAIDQRAGSCKVTRGVSIPDVSPIRDPIRFFIKNEEYFIFNPPEKRWEFNGFRDCRGVNIRCTVLTTSLDGVPNIVDPDTGVPTGETWLATNVEYGWSKRAPTARPPSDPSQLFDYPVSLFLRMYRFDNPLNPSPFSIRTEDIEYEFYEMSRERRPDDFDTSLCFRSLNYDYLHLVFTLKTNRPNTIDNNQYDRRDLSRRVYFTIMDKTGVKFSRITGLEVDHESTDNTIAVFFTLLGQTPKPESQSGVADDEKTADQARDDLRKAIDDGNFKFTIKLDDDSEVQYEAVAGSLSGSRKYLSSHTIGKKIVVDTYTKTSQALAIIFGLIIGVIVGAIFAAIIRKLLNKPLPNVPTAITNPARIGFHKGGSGKSSSDA